MRTQSRVILWALKQECLFKTTEVNVVWMWTWMWSECELTTGEWQQSQDAALSAVWPAGSQTPSGTSVWRWETPSAGLRAPGPHAGVRFGPDRPPHRCCGRGSGSGQGTTGMAVYRIKMQSHLPLLNDISQIKSCHFNRNLQFPKHISPMFKLVMRIRSHLLLLTNKQLLGLKVSESVWAVLHVLLH